MESSNLKLTFLNKDGKELGDKYIGELDDLNNPSVLGIPDQTRIINVADRTGKLMTQLMCGNRVKMLEILNKKGQNTAAFERNGSENDGSLYMYYYRENKVIKVDQSL